MGQTWEAKVPMSPAAELRTKEENPFRLMQGGGPTGGRTAPSTEGREAHSSEPHAKRLRRLP